MGHTYFIHAEIIEKYADYIELVFAEGVPKSYDYSEFGTEVLEKVPVISPTEFELVYNGSEFDFRTQFLNDILRGRDYLRLIDNESDAYVQSRAGTYYATICFMDGAKYCWDTQKNNDRSAVRIAITITSKKITPVDSLGSVEYTGSDIDIAEVMAQIPDFGEYVTVANGYSSVAKDVGPHSFNIRIKDEYLDSIVWDDGTNGTKTVSWEITPATITGTWNERGTVTFSEDMTYQGGFDSLIVYEYRDALTNEIVTELKKGETYRVEIKLTEEGAHNLILGDILNPETGLHENPYQFTLTVDIITLKRPVMNQTELEYTGQERTFSITIDGKSISEFSEYVEIVEDESDSLTQTNVKEEGYTVKIRLKNGASWEGYGSDDVVLRFDITKAVLEGEWNRDTGTLVFPVSYPGNFLSYEYRDKDDNVVTRAQMKKGETYKVKVTLTDTLNFKWGREPDPNPLEFILNSDIVVLVTPTLTGGTEYSYTGKELKLSIENWSYYSQYVDIVSGSLELSAAAAIPGDSYGITLKVKDGIAATFENDSDTFTLNFKILPATLTGEWGSDGKVQFTSTYEGNYDDVVDYVYTLPDGTPVNYEDLKDGQSYIVTVKLKDSQKDNFIMPDELSQPHDFTFEGNKGGSSFPWWIFLIIGIIVLLIIIIIIIIIVRRRRANEDDDYDDYYSDEDYYNEDEEDDFDDSDY